MALNRKELMKKGVTSLLGKIENPLSASNAAAPLTTIVRIPLSHIQANPGQPRSHFDESELKELADSIRQVDIISPITIHKIGPNQYQIISGERRFRAAHLAGLKDIPAYIRTTGDTHEVLELALLENLQRSDLNPIEIGLSFQRLLEECKYTHEELAQKMSKNRSTVSNYIRLLKLPPAVQAAVKNQSLSFGHARALISIENIDAQMQVFQEIIAKDLSVRETEKRVKDLNAPKPDKIPTPPYKKPDEVQLGLKNIEKKLTDHFNTKTHLEYNSKKSEGKLSIEYYSIEQLNALLEKLGIPLE